MAYAEQYAAELGVLDHLQHRYTQLLVKPHQIKLSTHVLGAGQFGLVALAGFSGASYHPAWTWLRSTGDTQRHPLVACKTIRAEDAASLTRLLLEMRLLATMHHPHIVRLLAAQEAVLPLIMVMEYCELGNLRDYLRRDKQAGVILRTQLDMGRQVAEAVEYLHSKSCLHRDLAARNVLVTSKGSSEINARAMPVTLSGVVLKLADLGLARIMRQEADYYRVRTGGEGPINPVWRERSFSVHSFSCFPILPFAPVEFCVGRCRADPMAVSAGSENTSLH